MIEGRYPDYLELLLTLKKLKEDSKFFLKTIDLNLQEELIKLIRAILIHKQH